jgi:DNA-binding CsgD family transcriptional regulator
MSQSQGITNFTFDSENCIGAARTIELGGDAFTATLMIPDVLYNDMVTRGQLRTIGIIAIVVLFTFGCCTIMSKKYVAPILRKIDAVTSNGEADGTLRIREIDDLFTYLEERDLQHDQQLKVLEEARAKAELEAEKTRLAYEKALEEYELAQKQIQQLSREQKKDIVLEDYEFFVCNLATLTPTEYRIYELYLEGKTAAEIAGIIGITDNTMKYHNKNIYSKLGISSRKQLLRFAALKQHQDRKEVVSK